MDARECNRVRRWRRRRRREGACVRKMWKWGGARCALGCALKEAEPRADYCEVQGQSKEGWATELGRNPTIRRACPRWSSVAGGFAPARRTMCSFLVGRRLLGEHRGSAKPGRSSLDARTASPSRPNTCAPAVCPYPPPRMSTCALASTYCGRCQSKSRRMGYNLFPLVCVPQIGLRRATGDRECVSP